VLLGALERVHQEQVTAKHADGIAPGEARGRHSAPFHTLIYDVVM
jgi:hypothetical protein